MNNLRTFRGPVVTSEARPQCQCHHCGFSFSQTSTRVSDVDLMTYAT